MLPPLSFKIKQSRQDLDQVRRLSVSEIPPLFRRGSNPAPAMRDFTSFLFKLRYSTGVTINMQVMVMHKPPPAFFVASVRIRTKSAG